MYRINTGHRSLGLNFNASGEAVFNVWAPYADMVKLEINGNRELKMNKETYGYWSLITDKIKPGDRYFYVLGPEKKYPDPASLSQPEGVHGPTEAVNLDDYEWRDKEWKGISLEDMIIYELHTGTFTKEGTFKAVTAKLDYLSRLGINAIEIMPVSQFPGSRNWGYDGVFVYAVQHSYGGLNGLRDLVQACHEKGIAVILDVVYNHNGPEGNYLPEFGPYFTQKYQIPWGKAVNYDDAYCYGVRQYYIENALMWFRDFHIDGLRLDAIHAIKDLSPEHMLAELSENTRRLKEITGRQHILIGECDLNDVKYIDPVKDRGYGLDTQWCDEFHHALHALSTGERLEYYADFGDIAHVEKTLKNAFVYEGQYSSHRKKFFGTTVGNRPGNNFVVFIQNHDQVGNRMRGERLNELVDFEMIKLLAGTMFISPYIPLIFMGEEYGETNPFLYFISHGDPELIRMVREGRKTEFKDFYGHGEPADPQDEKTFNQSKLTWNYLENGHENKLFRYYKEWIRLRKEHPVLRSRDRENLSVSIIDNTNIIRIDRSYNDRQLTGMLNFGDEAQEIKISDKMAPAGNILMNSASSGWGGPVQEDQKEFMAADIVKVSRYSILVYDYIQK